MLKPPVDQYSAQEGSRLSRLRVNGLPVSCVWLIFCTRAENGKQHPYIL